MEDIVLMSKNTPVFEFNRSTGYYKVLNKTLLPYELKGRVFDLDLEKDVKTASDLMKFTSAADSVYDSVLHYLACRTLPLSRENAKKLYSLFGFDQLQTERYRAMIAISCRSVSLQDTYWVKNASDTATWEEVNLRNNSLSETVANVSLHGTSLSLQGNERTPELNGQGSYAKAWKRENGELWLYKLGTRENNNEAQIEVMVSKLLDNMNVEHVEYLPAVSQGKTASKCKCMTTDNISILPGMEFISYCNANNMDPDREIFKIDSDNIYKMWIVDYLISNGDRHSMNWGFFYNADTMEIKGAHPLFDHNNAFDESIMKTPDALSLFKKDKTMKELAMYAMERTDFYFYRNFTPQDFLNREQYDSFMSKAKELNIPVKEREYETGLERLAKETQLEELGKETRDKNIPGR